jgi:alpha-L-arabinofuranosidase
VLEGEWNDKVLKETADIADGIIVHHYPQHYGEENDFAILSAPQSLEGIFDRLNKTVAKYSKGKKLGIWLTEWNSVDFNPGPQTVSLVNGLFVADYIGMLVKVGAESAQYWDIHNDVTPEGGDYGYLSRSYDEQIGGNMPRPSYYAFQMVSDALRGQLVESKTGEDNLTSYVATKGGRKAMMVVNKSPVTVYKAKLAVPGFSGKATVQTLAAPGKKAGEVVKMKGIDSKSVTITEGQVFDFAPHSITTITIE